MHKQTCPPNRFLREPALIIKLSNPKSPISQCLALNTVHESRIVPPQNCIPPYKIATCHGIMLGAGSPPTTRKEFFIKSGIEAEMVKGTGYSISRQIIFNYNKKYLVTNHNYQYCSQF